MLLLLVIVIVVGVVVVVVVSLNRSRLQMSHHILGQGQFLSYLGFWMRPRISIYKRVCPLVRLSVRNAFFSMSGAPSSVDRRTKSYKQTKLHSDLPIDTKTYSLMVQVLAKHYGPTDLRTNGLNTLAVAKMLNI